MLVRAGLAPSTTVEDLKELFSSYGVIAIDKKVSGVEACYAGS